MTRRPFSSPAPVRPGSGEWSASIPAHPVSSGVCETAGFSWQSTTVTGRGALVYCPECRTTTLVQFFSSGDPIDDAVPGRLLTSFRDHARDETVPWAVYDICARLPSTFRLGKYRFDAGEFELVFGAKKQRLTLLRWSPAEVLLRNHTLSDILQVRFNSDGNLPLSVSSNRDASVEGVAAPASI